MNTRNQQAFTLVELIIVTAMLGVLTGFGARLWLYLEHSAKAVNQNLEFFTKSQLIVQQIVDDIRMAETLASKDDALLKIGQIDAQGRRIEVCYMLEGNELTRSVWFQGVEVQSRKVATLNSEALTISPQPQGLIRIQIERSGRDRPQQVQTRRLISYTRPLGVR